ncbi:hypothetical protein Pflav_012020 [Phytohabitans flavus]|uniref:BON domain-containing protein n=1 Tax=Phytohabitans flavus TaxID=1076124 RepID=A0A6F8XLU8_9ACTN|nr:hypothetical protein Pflav_012020 [Phytohabitans flavus]
MVRRFIAGLVIGLSVTVALTACAGGGEEAPGSPAVTSEQPDGSSNAVELAVLKALDYDARAKAARYEPADDKVVVTVFAGGAQVPAAELKAYESAAEQASGGLDVVVEVSAADPPKEN